MDRADHKEKLRILAIRVQEARDAVNRLAYRNTHGLTPMERADLDAEFAMAQADLIRAQREMARATIAASE